jgi:hypothetical protein
MSVLRYCEFALYGISESLQHSNMELPEETTQLCPSLHVELRHAIALSCNASANAVLKRRDNIITEAKSVIRLPQVRSAPLGECFLFQDSLEEAIKVQTTLDPIPVMRVSWPDKAKKQTPYQVQSSYFCRDFQGGLPRSRPRVQAPRNERSVGRSAQGVRGDKRGHIGFWKVSNGLSGKLSALPLRSKSATLLVLTCVLPVGGLFHFPSIPHYPSIQ